MDKPEEPLLKKTTLLIPEALWLKARRQALDERTNLRKLLLEGLEMRLQRKPRKVKAPVDGVFGFYEKKVREMERAEGKPAPSSKKGGKR